MSKAVIAWKDSVLFKYFCREFVNLEHMFSWQLPEFGLWTRSWTMRGHSWLTQGCRSWPAAQLCQLTHAAGSDSSVWEWTIWGWQLEEDCQECPSPWHSGSWPGEELCCWCSPHWSLLSTGLWKLLDLMWTSWTPEIQRSILSRFLVLPPIPLCSRW